MKTSKIFNLIMVVVFAFSLLEMPTSASAQGYNPSIDVVYNEDGVRMLGWNLGAEVTLTIDTPTNGSGIDYSTSKIIDNANSSFSTGNSYDIQPGDVVTVSDNITIRQLTVANIRVTGVNPNTDIIFGMADPYDTITVYVYQNCVFQGQTTTADQYGNWSVNFSGTCNVSGTTRIRAVELDDDNDSTRFDFIVPDILVQLQVNRVSSAWMLGSEVELTIDDPTNGEGIDYTETKIATGFPIAWDPSRSYINFNPNDFVMHHGDLVTLSDGITTIIYVVSDINITDVDASLDTVSGTASPGSQIEVGPNICTAYGCYGVRRVIANALGIWHADFAHIGIDGDEQDIIDISLSMRIEGRHCNDDGNCTSFTWGVPYIDASVDGDSIGANEWPLNRSVTLTIDQAGTPEFPDYTDTKAVQPDAGNSDVGEVNFNLYGIYQYQVGDLITLSDGTLTKTLMVANILVTCINLEAETISGTADPGAEIEVRIWSNNAPYRRVIADGDGHWVADFSIPWNDQSTYDLVPGLDGGLFLYDNDRDSTSAKWTTIHSMDVHVDENFVATSGWLPGTPLRMAISGSVTYSDELFPSENRTQFDWPRSLAHLQVGDIITITDGFMTINHAIPPILVTNIDVDADTVEGIATPFSNVKVHTDTTITGGGCCAGRWVTADASGNWIADFHDPLAAPPRSLYPTADLVPGSPGQAIEYDDEGNETWVNWGVPNPRFETNLTQNFVHGFEWSPGTSVTVTIDDASNGVGIDYTSTLPVRTDNPWGSEPWVGFDPPFSMEPGDTVTLIDGDFVKSHVATHISVTSVDVDTDTVSGTANPFARIDIWTDTPDCCVNRSVFADSNGDWVANFSIPGDEDWESQTVDIQPGSGGQTAENDNDGDTTNIRWQALNPRFSADLLENKIGGFEWLNGLPITVTVDDPHTTQNPDFTATQIADVPTGASDEIVVLFDMGSLVLQPGFLVAMTDGKTTKTHTILYVDWTSIDFAGDFITGIGEPGMITWVWAYDSNVGMARRIEPNADRSWTANFAEQGGESWEGILDIHPGMSGGVSQVDADGDETMKSWIDISTALNQPPVANAGLAQIAFAGETITLDASASSDPESGTLTYTWDLDNDGQYDDANGVTITTSFLQTGNHVIKLQVTDDGDLSDTDTVTITILPWTLAGFNQPVDMNGIYNIVKGGSTVPFKFEIFAGSIELTSPGSMKSFAYVQISCDENALTDQIETVVMEGSGLRYDPIAGQFIYNWKTPLNPGKCYRVLMTTMDDSSLAAYFKLK